MGLEDWVCLDRGKCLLYYVTGLRQVYGTFEVIGIVLVVIISSCLRSALWSRFEVRAL